MSHYVPETHIDYQAIFVRGGANHGDEDFAMIKCPACKQVYLLEYEVDTVYIDGADLSKREDVTDWNQPFSCVNCTSDVPRAPWAGPRAEERFLVTWQELNESAWYWVATPSASFGEETQPHIAADLRQLRWLAG